MQNYILFCGKERTAVIFEGHLFIVDIFLEMMKFQKNFFNLLELSFEVETENNEKLLSNK